MIVKADANYSLVDWIWRACHVAVNNNDFFLSCLERGFLIVVEIWSRKDTAGRKELNVAFMKTVSTFIVVCSFYLLFLFYTKDGFVALPS